MIDYAQNAFAAATIASVITTGKSRAAGVLLANRDSFLSSMIANDMVQTSLNYETKSKREMLRDAMLAGRRMSKQDILRNYGIWNSGHIIWLLRKEGLPIKTEMVTRGENTFAEYFLETSPL